jgi:DNA polymerase III epsilon subunit-like protein
MTLHLAIDVETSGLFDYTKPADAEGQPRAAQIGMIWLDHDLSTIREAEWLIKPIGWTLEAEAAAVNGLTHELLEAEGGPIDEALRDYARAIDERHVIVGFNAAYDIKLMRGELRRAKLEDRYMLTRTLDVMQGCRKIVDARTATGKSKAPKLEEACTFFGIDREPLPHRALGGARACVLILRKLREMGQMPPYKDPYDKTSKGNW